jgi:miniconductance mechanosensitive channel
MRILGNNNFSGMKTKITSSLFELIKNMGANDKSALIIQSVVIFLIIITLAYLANWVTKKVIKVVVHRIIKKTKTTYDDTLLRHKVFTKISHLVPAIIIHYSIELAFPNLSQLVHVIQAMTYIYMILVVMLVIDSFLNALLDIYQTFEISKEIPIKGYVQVLKIVIYFITIILVLSVILGKSPIYFFTGLGAIAAILLLVFKDTILGFVASIQLTANDMVKPGDWVQMPSENADGDVMDISVTTVKVRNFDKTITTIPTYHMVSQPFKNWKGMTLAGARRMKRSINIDMKSVGLSSEEMIEKFSRIHVLKDYIKKKKEEIDKYNEEHNIDRSSRVNGRAITNIGTFRKYLELYLQNHPMIRNDLTMLVRQLPPSETGIPIEVYAFIKDPAWAAYESIQADIFDHILAVIPEFGLRAYQNPSGEDFQSLARENIE